MRKRGFNRSNTNLVFIQERSEHIYNERFTSSFDCADLKHLQLLYTRVMPNALEAEQACVRIK